jgi:hypothetical protein
MGDSFLENEGFEFKYPRLQEALAELMQQVHSLDEHQRWVGNSAIN